MDGCPLWVLCVLSGRGLYDGLITRPEEFYRLWCVLVCDLGTSRMVRLKLIKGCKCRIEKRKEKKGISWPTEYYLNWTYGTVLCSVTWLVALQHPIVSRWMNESLYQSILHLSLDHSLWFRVNTSEYNHINRPYGNYYSMPRLRRAGAATVLTAVLCSFLWLFRGVNFLLPGHLHQWLPIFSAERCRSENCF